MFFRTKLFSFIAFQWCFYVFLYIFWESTSTYKYSKKINIKSIKYSIFLVWNGMTHSIYYIWYSTLCPLMFYECFVSLLNSLNRVTTMNFVMERYWTQLIKFFLCIYRLHIFELVNLNWTNPHILFYSRGILTHFKSPMEFRWCTYDLSWIVIGFKKSTSDTLRLISSNSQKKILWKLFQIMEPEKVLHVLFTWIETNPEKNTCSYQTFIWKWSGSMKTIIKLIWNAFEVVFL